MKYYSHYIWESGSEEKENPLSVVLQQVNLENRCCLLACVCDGSKSSKEVSLISGYLTKRLVEWFHHRYVLLIQKQREESVLRELQKELLHIEEELQDYGRRKGVTAVYDVWGLFICDNQFWSFSKGECKGYLFNRRFNRKQRRCLQQVFLLQDDHLPYDEHRMDLVQGNLQKDIGILICNAAFDENICREEMLSVLFEKRLSEGEIRKRLHELWRENKERGYTGYAGAVYFRTE